MLESCDIGLKSSLMLDGGVGPRKQKIDLVKNGRINEARRDWNFGAEISFLRLNGQPCERATCHLDLLLIQRQHGEGDSEPVVGKNSTTDLDFHGCHTILSGSILPCKRQ